VNALKNLHLVLLFVLLAFVSSNLVAETASNSAMATLSRRSAKPGDHLELVVTVRGATHPLIQLPSNLTGLQFKLRHKPQYLTVENEGVWLFRYRVTPKKIGDDEIPPIQIVDGATTLQTKPILLHVSPNGELPPLSARELALGVNIPDSLSQEVMKAVQQPTPKPTPAATPRDSRNFGARAASSCWHGLQKFWNYPGK
jgi:hypothetical protein